MAVELRYTFGTLGTAELDNLRLFLHLDAETRQWVEQKFAKTATDAYVVLYRVVGLFAYKWIATAVFDFPEVFMCSQEQWELLLAR